MKKVVALGVVALGLAGYLEYSGGWLTHVWRATASYVREQRSVYTAPHAATHGGAPAPGATPLPSAPVVPVSGTPAPSASPTPSVSPAPAELAALPKDLNLLSPDAGGHIESASSQFSDNWSARRLIDGNPATGWCSDRAAAYPHEIVFSFFEHQNVLLSGVAVNPVARNDDYTAKDVEVWTSVTSATEGFAKVAAATLQREAIDQPITFNPVEARYLKIRILSAYGKHEVCLAEVKVQEGQRAGYSSLMARNPGLHAILMEPASPIVTPGDAPLAVVPGSDVADCAPRTPTAPPMGPESRNVLVVSRLENAYPPLGYSPAETSGGLDYSIYGRIHFTWVKPEDLTVPLLAGSTDTVVLSQICDIKTRVSDTFKKALVAWVALGHKLIIHDADDCGSHSIPDYSFLPYKFATSNPGAQGARGDRLIFVEENTIGNAKRADPAFVDIESWVAGAYNFHNEIGDSNTVTEYDPHWCGHLFGTNVLKKNGFMEAYAHYGKGLIIYDGFDNDQAYSVAYRQLVGRELAQGVNPDNLLCSARLGDFVITTEQRLKSQVMVPGRTYTYPLTLLSNQGYSGTIHLSLTSTPPDPTMTFRFEPDTIALSEIAQAMLTVQTTHESLSAGRALSIRGTDAQPRSNAVCVQLTERKTGGIQVVSSFHPSKKPSRNLEIVLDSSGSMKLPLGRKTRWATALDVFREVLAKLPDDFNVGLRVYAHRYSARSPQTCTDTELLQPVAKLNRDRILSTVGRLQPKGETPLVYSVLQTIQDLKAVGGGSVVLITDGEETCHGDPVDAATRLNNAGIDIKLNIVGFTLKGRQVQQQLTTFAESTGGTYYSAQSGEALARALWIAAVDRIPYTIFDAAGKQVAAGDAGGPGEELPPGEYKVVMKAADQELVEQVTVASAADTVLKVILKGDRFAIER